MKKAYNVGDDCLGNLVPSINTAHRFPQGFKDLVEEIHLPQLGDAESHLDFHVCSTRPSQKK